MTNDQGQMICLETNLSQCGIDYTWSTTVRNGHQMCELWHDEDTSINIHTYCIQQILHTQLTSVKNVTKAKKKTATSMESIISH
jgi:hypothetical protein